jgi:hypothetical protein
LFYRKGIHSPGTDEEEIISEKHHSFADLTDKHLCMYQNHQLKPDTPAGYPLYR